MSDAIKYKNYEVEIVINKKLKHSYISIDRNGVIILKTPNSSKYFADSLLKEKSKWIQKQFLKIENLQTINEKSLYSKEFLHSRLDFFSKEMQLSYKKITFKKMKSRWGSCNTRREITLNSELTKVSKNLIDYVVVHELAHLKHMNHSKSFHALVSYFLPNAKEYREELKKIRLS